MTFELKEYGLDDMEEQDRDTAPSLDLPAFVVEKFFLPKDNGKYMLFLANVKKDWLPENGCPFCYSKDTLIRSGRTKPRAINDVVRNNYRTLIVFQPLRLECSECKQRFVPNVDGIADGHPYTERLLEYIQTEAFLQPHTKLAEITGLSAQTIANIMDEEIARYDAQREVNPLQAPRVLGIDEKHICHKARGVLVDSENGTLLEMLEDNTESSFTAAIKKMKGWDTDIQVVTTDMANQYIRWLKTLLPKTTIVVDHFHVIQDIQRKLSSTKSLLYEYRKKLVNELPKGDEKTRQKEVLRIVLNNKRLFNYSTESLARDEKHKRAEKIVTVMDEFPEFKLMRMLYTHIEEMYRQDNRKDAEALWNEWQEMLPPIKKADYDRWCDLYSLDKGGECFEAFKSLNRGGFTQYKEYILNYFEPGCRETNGPTEGVNSLIRKIDSEGNGYGFKRLRAKSLYASLIYERVNYSFDIKTIKAWTPTFSMSIGGRRSGTTRLIDQYVFSEEKEALSIPSAGGLSDNTWLFESLDDESVVHDKWRRNMDADAICAASERLFED